MRHDLLYYADVIDVEMIEDNTPTVKASPRKRSPHMRLRLDTVKRLKSLNKRPDSKRKVEKSSDIESNTAGATDRTKLTSRSKESSIRTKTPRVKKNKLAKPAVPKAKFRRRQLHKAWLPTHLFHAKRAHMTPPKEPLWRMAIPLSPTAKSYRPTHRASSIRGAVIWDISYMSTISLAGSQAGLLEVLKDLGVGLDEPPRFWNWEAKRWINGCRSWDGWLYHPGSMQRNSIASVKIVWTALSHQNESVDGHTAASTTPSAMSKRKAIIRIHPSAFLELWEVLLPLAKAKKPSVAVEDLRFEIGSIELVGPSSTEALVGVLKPSPIVSDASRDMQDTSNFWSQLFPITDPASLPANAVINMEISDPRLNYQSGLDKKPADHESHQRLLKILSDWPPDKAQTISKLFDRGHRIKACRQLPSQRAINRRKTLAGPDVTLESLADDPRIPVMLLTTQTYGSGRASWSLLLPWKCVLHVWHTLVYFRLSGGRTVNFGGLEQTRQICLESGTPWFPGDFPGTKAGIRWEELELQKRKAEWEKRPKGKRIEWDSLNLGGDRKGEVGLGWACDWEKLVQIGSENVDPKPHLHRIPSSIALSMMRSGPSDSEPTNEPQGLVTIKIEMLGRGVPPVCARIYRLPTTDPVSREKWISIATNRSTGRKNGGKPPILGFGQTKDEPAHIRRQHLAASLLEPEDVSNPGDKAYPSVPDEHDLIGFVTTGNFTLSEGKGVGVGSILLEKVATELPEISSEKQRKEQHLCIVREAGHSIGRVARWHFTE